MLTIFSGVYLLTSYAIFFWTNKKKRCLLYFLGVIFLITTIFMFRGTFSHNEQTTLALRDNYVQELMHYEGVRYIWGGENIWGIDCSGLPRKALRNALVRFAFFKGDWRCLKHALKSWWFDASAEALANGYQNYISPLDLQGTVADAPDNRLSPGNLAITKDGKHIMVYIGKDSWISADPLLGKVVVENPSVSSNPWYKVDVAFYEWNVLSSSSEL